MFPCSLSAYSQTTRSVEGLTRLVNMAAAHKLDVLLWPCEGESSTTNMRGGHVGGLNREGAPYHLCDAHTLLGQRSPQLLYILQNWRLPATSSIGTAKACDIQPWRLRGLL